MKDDLRAYTVAGIDAEIARLTQLRNSLKAGDRSSSAAPTGRKRRKLTAAEKKAISVRMKAAWAKRKKKVAKG